MTLRDGLPYKYDTLPAGVFARYMILEPGTDQEPLRCTLHTTSLDAMPDFEAISYVWGNPCRSQVIFCGQRIIHITATLRDALCQVRLPTKPRTLWADSICIHQENKSEQGHQVGLMGQIYSRTKRTLVCLGEDPGQRAPHILSLIPRVIDLKAQLPQNANYTEDTFPYIHQDDPIMSDPGWDSIETLLEHSWFRRLWVVQEAALAPEVVLHWGVHKIDWDSLLHTVIYADALAPVIIMRWSPWLPDLHNLRLSGKYDSLPQALREHMKRFSLEVLNMMRQGRALGVTEERDRIYAVLGLLKMFPGKQKEVEMIPDYSKPTHDIFCEFAKEYLQITKDLGILSCVEHDERSLGSKTPSWIPLWNASSDLVWSLRGYIPLKSTRNKIPEPLIISGGKLRLRGVLLGRIQFVSCSLNRERRTITSQMAQVWNELQSPEHKSAYSTDNQPLAFTWTMCVGKRSRLSVERERESEAQFLFELKREGAKFGGRMLKEIGSWEKLDPSGGFALKVSKIARNRRFIMSDRGYYGLGPCMARKDDLCCIIFGATCPYVLRETTTQGEYQFVGDMYLTAETSNASWSGWSDWLGLGRGFTLLGRQSGKDWTNWGLEERDIVLC